MSIAYGAGWVRTRSAEVVPRLELEFHNGTVKVLREAHVADSTVTAGDTLHMAADFKAPCLSKMATMANNLWPPIRPGNFILESVADIPSVLASGRGGARGGRGGRGEGHGTGRDGVEG